MADESGSNETVELSEEMARRRSRVNPDDLIGPTCMFWAMIAGFIVLGGMMLVWGLGHLDKIVQ